MRVIVKMEPSAARALQHGQTTAPGAASLRQLTDELGLSLEPLHPGVEDPDLGSYFSAEVEEAAVTDLLDRLRSHQAIEGAYTKPPDEPA